jgi:hypothetical protein
MAPRVNPPRAPAPSRMLVRLSVHTMSFPGLLRINISTNAKVNYQSQVQLMLMLMSGLFLCQRTDCGSVDRLVG